MVNSTRATTAQRLGRIAVGGAVALLLAGAWAAPAAAKPWSEAAIANGMIQGCFELGGDPEVTETLSGNIYVDCNFDGGGNIQCVVWATGPIINCL